LSFVRACGLLPIALTGFVWMAPCPAAEPLSGILACRGIADPAARLACFDRESAGLAAAPAAPAASAPASAASAPAPASAAPASAGAAPAVDATAISKENFGLSEGQVAKKEVAAGKRPADVKDIQAHITAVSTTGTGFSVFTLDNGQVWIEITPDGDLMAKPGDLVTLSRGVLNSYWLQNHNGRGAKVHRVL
jgi:hypothetical protein